MQHQEFISMDAFHLVAELPGLIRNSQSFFFHTHHHWRNREERLEEDHQELFKGFFDKVNKVQAVTGNNLSYHDSLLSVALSSNNIGIFLGETLKFDENESKTVFEVLASKLSVSYRHHIEK